MPIVPLKELKALLPKGKRIMGIDHSTKALGLALADPNLTYATPLKTIRRSGFARDMAELAAVCRAYDVAAFVIGMPYHMDGTTGPRTDSVKHFGDNILKAHAALGFDPLIAFQDERLSTHAAEDKLSHDLGMGRDKRAKVVDALAAQNILQSALDTLFRN
jgi:putative Holliday junction resolvase